MTDNLNDYILRAQEPFSRRPLGEVDSLALCTVAYTHMEAGPAKERLARADASEAVPLPLALCGVPHAALFGTSWLHDYDGDGFMGALLQSRRFCGARVAMLDERVDDAQETQFCAMTFLLDDGSAYVAFRGTDDSLAGWKEDFNLCFMPTVPAQGQAADYLARVAKALPGAPLYVGGHSKGGNLAEYAALVCDEAVYRRIRGVYDHDGPFFFRSPSPRLESEHYGSILHKSVPKSSVFGMLMEDRAKELRFVDADGFLFAQHAPTNWKVDGDAFAKADGITDDARAFDATMNEWMANHSPEERARFIDTVHGVFKATGVRTWTEYDADHLANLGKTLQATGKLDKKTRDMVVGMFVEAARIYGARSLDGVAGAVATSIASVQEGASRLAEGLPQAPARRPKQT